MIAALEKSARAAGISANVAQKYAQDLLRKIPGSIRYPRLQGSNTLVVWGNAM